MQGWISIGIQWQRCLKRARIGPLLMRWYKIIIDCLFSLLILRRRLVKELHTNGGTWWKMSVGTCKAGDPGVVPGSCPNRKELKPLNSRSSSLFLMNYFPTIPVQSEACREHSSPLADMVGTCYKSAGNAMPNFIAVNFYMRSDGGGVFDVVDRINGQSLCGCSTVTLCQVGAHFRSCKTINSSNTTPATPGTAGSFSGSVDLRGTASTVNIPSIFVLCFFLFLSSFSLSKSA